MLYGLPQMQGCAGRAVLPVPAGAYVHPTRCPPSAATFAACHGNISSRYSFRTSYDHSACSSCHARSGGGLCGLDGTMGALAMPGTYAVTFCSSDSRLVSSSTWIFSCTAWLRRMSMFATWFSQ